MASDLVSNGDGDILAIGLMSGTSMDGIDACVVKISCEKDGKING